ncbi:MAG: uracil phosphoribosyltransferase [Chloroflexota bacterium]
MSTFDHVYELSHPIVHQKLTLIRDVQTNPIQFRQLVKELSTILAYEATYDLSTKIQTVQTPLTSVDGIAIAEQVGLVPILRAGLGMVDGALSLLPNADVWHLGFYRDEETLEPVLYYNKLPEKPTVQFCLVLDPMLATGGSAIAAIRVLKRWGIEKIKFVGLIAAPEGIQTVHRAYPDVDIYVAAIDERLTVDEDPFPPGFIWPGLGDAGDRQFGT